MKILVDTAITVPVNIAQLISDSDFKTIDEGIAYNESGMDLNWNFETKAGVITQTNVTPTTGGDYDWSHVGNGMYKIEIPASGGVSANNTEEGFGWFSGVCDGVLPFVGPKIQFSPANVINSLVDGSDILQVDAIESNIYLVEGDIVSATSASQFIIDGDYDVDDAYNGMVIVVEDDTTGFYEARRIIDYIGATKEVFLDRALSFTPVADDDFYIMGTGYCDVNVTDISGTSQTANDNGADVNLILADVENINGDAMRGTDGANTVVPDIAGTAAGLHGTTDSRIDDLELVSGQLFTIIIEDVAGLNGDAMRGTDGANQIAPNTVIPDVAGTAAGLHSITDGKVDVVDGKLDTLLTRLSAVRAGYLDNLSAGAVALEASITAIKGAGWTDENLKTMNTVLDVIAVDVAGINGAAMRGTDSASTHSATDVWAVGTRTLTSFGTLVADIATSVWSKATSALTTVGSIGKKLADWVLGTDDKVILSSDAQTGVTIPTVTTVGNMRGTDGANTVVPDVAGTAAALHVITDGKIDTLLIRLSAVRATYLDNLSAGAVSLQSTLTSLASVSALEATLTDMKGAGWTDENLKTIQDVVEAFTPGGDATASNQTAIAALIAALQGSGFVESEDSNEAIRNRGDAAWITGGGLSGSNAITVNIHDALSVNIVECAVEIWDEAGTAFYERQSSDSNGQCLFNMDSGTYTVKMHKAGYTFSNQVLVVTATAAVTYTGTSFVAPVPVGANTCVVYDIMYAQSGVQFASSASGTAVIISLPYDYGDGLHPGSQLSGTYNSVTGVLSWEIVRGAKVQFSAGVYGMDKIVIIPDQASARLTDIED